MTKRFHDLILFRIEEKFYRANRFLQIQLQRI